MYTYLCAILHIFIFATKREWGVVVKAERVEDLSREIKIPVGMIGVVSEVAIMCTGTYQIMLIVFPGKPLPPASKVPGVLEVTGRTLTLLRCGESCTARLSSALTSSKRKVTNEDGVAKVERAGVTRSILGPHTRYQRSEDDRPIKLR